MVIKGDMGINKSGFCRDFGAWLVCHGSLDTWQMVTLFYSLIFNVEIYIDVIVIFC